MLESKPVQLRAGGRLIEAGETPSGGSITTRSYGYDKDSNRQSMMTIPSTLGGACGTGTATEQKHSYDQADRLVDTGVVYDNFGRITTLPAVDAGGQTLTTMSPPSRGRREAAGSV